MTTRTTGAANAIKFHRNLSENSNACSLGLFRFLSEDGVSSGERPKSENRAVVSTLEKKNSLTVMPWHTFL